MSKYSSYESEFSRYESLRLQLAELGNQFLTDARLYPGVNYRVLQADHSMGNDWWSEWIDTNRTQNDSHEYFDVHPATWAGSDWTLDDLKFMEGRASNFCGLFESDFGNLGVAFPHLKRLSERANAVLISLQKEVEQHPELIRLASFGHLCPGHRGWLDSVRNTAELNRNAYVDVKTKIWGVQDDMLSRVRAIASIMRQTKAARSKGIDPECGVIGFELYPDVFTASGNAIRLWLKGVTEENVYKPIHTFNPICIPSSGGPDEAFAILNNCESKLPSIPSKSVSQRSKKRGRKGSSELERTNDKRVFDSWKKSGYQTHKEFAQKHGYSLPVFKRQIEREAKRRKRSENRFDSA